MKRLLGLGAFEVFVWLLLLLCTLLISRVAFGINLGPTFAERFLTQAVRLAISGIIILGWLVAWKKTTDFYFWRTVSRKKATA